MVLYCLISLWGWRPFEWNWIRRRYPAELHSAAGLGEWHRYWRKYFNSLSHKKYAFWVCLATNSTPCTAKKTKVGGHISEFRRNRFGFCASIGRRPHSRVVKKRYITFIHNVFNNFYQSSTYVLDVLFLWLPGKADVQAFLLQLSGKRDNIYPVHEFCYPHPKLHTCRLWCPGWWWNVYNPLTYYRP